MCAMACYRMLFGLVLGVQLGEYALAFIGLADNGLELYDRNFGRAGGSGGNRSTGGGGWLCCGLSERAGAQCGREHADE